MTTRTVGAGGAAPNYTTIASAVAVASDGDIIQIVTNVQTECGIVITTSLTIQGQGMTNTILQGATTRSNAANRIFQMNNAAKALTIKDMTVQYGYSTVGVGSYCGGAILNNAGTVTVQNCVLQMNDAYLPATAAYGGAIAQLNTAANALTLKNCLVANNTTGPTNQTTSTGGALYLGDGSLFVDGCCFNGNSTPGAGGAIKIAKASGQCVIQNSTFYGNLCNITLGSGGGGALSFPASMTLTAQVCNCTIVSNNAGIGYGGGVYAGSTLVIVSSIIASNAATGGGNEYFNGANIILSNSLVQGTGSGTLKSDYGNIKLQSPKLSPLAYNGGPTPTMALAWDSPCTNQGGNPLGLTYDQRGYPYDRAHGSASDIGAYECGAGVVLTYSGTNFYGNTSPYNGLITNSLWITLTGDTFTGGVGNQITNKVAVSNLPAGLAVSMLITNASTNLLVQLSGNATQHAAVNSISNLTFTFQDGAFTANNGYATQVVGYVCSNLIVSFSDPVLSGTMTYSSSNFYGNTVTYDGSITNSVMISLTGDTFLPANGSQITNQVTVTNLPAGLSLSMLVTNAQTNVLVQLSGKATQHAAANSVGNLGFTFQNGAFAANNAGVITGAATTNLNITFHDPPPGGLIYSRTNFVEDAVYNDGRIDTNTAISITLTGDTFAVTAGAVFTNQVAFTNIPAGLTGVVTCINSTNVSFVLIGQAASHAALNSVTNLGLTFLDVAFTHTHASVIAGSAETNLVISYLDPAVNVKLTYNGTVFTESAANDGSMGNTLSLTLTNDIFNGTNNQDFVSSGLVLASHVPSGLTAVVQRVDLTHATVSLTGNAIFHNSSSNVSNLGLAFQNSAFHNTLAASVTNATRADLQIDYFNSGLTYSGTNFVETWQNDGSMGNTLTLTLAGDAFSGTNGENFAANGKVTAGNVPSGLTASVVRRSAGQVVFGLMGNASPNNVANSISNLSLTFNDAAFTMGGSALATNGSRNNLLVTFVGSTAPSNFWVSVSGNNATGNGTEGNPWRTIQYALNSSAVRADTFDVINVMAGTYDETNILNGGKVVAIQGAGKDQTIVEAGSVYNAAPFDSHVFSLSGNGVALRDMTIRYGNVTNTTHGAGAFLTGGDMILERCRVVSNTCYSAAASYYGGSVYLVPATTGTLTLKSCEVIGNTSFNGGIAGVGMANNTVLVMTNCVVANNVSAYGGGAIYAGGSSLEMWDSVVTNNVVTVAGQPGGGICVGVATCTSLIERCTIAWNQSPGSGGGLYLIGTNLFVNSTIYGNTIASGNGGGVAINAGYTRFYNSTIASNTAANGLGGGLYNAYGTWSAASTLVAGNTASNSLDVGFSSSVMVDDHCFIGNNTNSGMTAGQPNANGSYVGTGGLPLNPQLLPLASNGGLTPTCAIQSGSLCRDHGNNLLGLVNDQRGDPYVRIRGSAADIGAFEYGAGVALTYSSTNFYGIPTDGSITNSLLITITNDVFTGTDGSQITNNVVVSGVPAGLSGSMVRTNNGTNVVFALTGNAASYATNTMTITFHDGAFGQGQAAQMVNGSNFNVSVTFAVRSLGYSGTTFYGNTAPYNGTIANSLVLTITNGIFAGTDGGQITNSVAVSNVPADLLVSMVRTNGGTNVLVSLMGTVTSYVSTNGAANNTSSLIFTFRDGAFTGGHAAQVVNNSLTNAVVYQNQAPGGLTYNGSIFFGNTAPYNGSVTNSLTIALRGDTFTGGVGGQLTNSVTVTNLPAGLALSMIVTNAGTNVLVQLLGNATQCAASNSIGNLGLTFQNGAFTGGNAWVITNAVTTNLSITFQDPPPGGLVFSRTNFVEDAVYNDGRIDTNTAISITLTGDTFNVTSGSVFSTNQVTFTNMPGGLTGVVTCVNSSNATFALAGAAISNASANNISNLGIAFQNAAFNHGQAGVISGVFVTNISITFTDIVGTVQLAYSGTVFTEAGTNDGSMGNTLSLTLQNDVFNGTNNQDFVSSGLVLASHVPSGLTAVVQRVDLTHATVSLMGKALFHNSSSNVSNLGLAFQNTAFHNTLAASVTNATRADLQIDYFNSGLTYSGTNFMEYWQNDGSMGNTLTLTLAGDTFTGTNGENFVANGKVTAGNVPSGLTASVVRQSAGHVVFGLLGNASPNNVGNSISNLSLTFNDAAFTMGGSALVTNGSRNNLLVTFVGSSAPSNFWVSVSGNNATGNGTAGNPWRTIQYALNNAAVRTDAFDVINVMAGTYDETNIVCGNGPMVVAINGAGKDQTIVEAGSVYNAAPFDSRVFSLNGNGVVLRDMTIRYGNVTNITHGSGVFLTGGELILERCRVVSNTCYGAAASYYGGAVFLTPTTTGTLTLKSCEVIGNASFNGGVAGVGVTTLSALVMTNCVVANNVSAYGGGAIYAGGSSLVMCDSVVTNNVVTVAGQPGGGICVGVATCTSLIERCTIAWNQSPGSGGGLYLIGTNVLVNSTIFGNSVASGNGGGVAINAGYTRFYNSTIAGNTAVNGLGGGLYNAYGTWGAASTLVAGNTASNSLDVGYSSFALADDHCFIGNNTNSGMTAGQPNANGSYVGTGASPLNPQLLPLANNGGLTPTCAIQLGSLCRDHGNNPLGLTTDQRATIHDRQCGIGVDVGAYEFGAGTPGTVYSIR
ncbi:MAG: choice-of-anchor Q domain-containing protein [bacterium]